MQFVRKLEPFQNVVATGRAVLSSKVVLGQVIERITLELGGTFTKAMITAIRVKLNGKTIFGDVSGTVLDLIQRYLLLVNDAARLTIDFSEPVARSIQGQLMGAIHTAAAGVTDFTIEVDIAGATNPTLTAWAQLRSPLSVQKAGFDPATLPMIRALVPTTVVLTATGEIQADVNYGSRRASLLKRQFWYGSTLTSLRIRRDSLDLFEGLTRAQVDFNAQEFGRQNQTNLFCWDPLIDGNQSDAVATLREDGTPATFQFLPTGTAGTLSVLTDIYTTLPAL
ncbi:MAG: hypothetical protein IT484_00940 [Gammaproteobacteria bacterium]|nr:hypothetical protein [Gammaproteobacteria bacterium]